jgi:hypothetical protein
MFIIIEIDADYRINKAEQLRVNKINAQIKSIVSKEILIPDTLKSNKK